MRTYAVAACRLLYLGLTALAIAGVSGLPTAVFGQPMAGPIPPGSYAGVHEEPPVAHETARATSMYWSLFPSIAKLRLREGQQVEAPQGEIIREIRVDGNTFLEDETVQFFLSFVEGDAFDWATAQQNFRTMLNSDFFDDIKMSSSTGGSEYGSTCSSGLFFATFVSKVRKTGTKTISWNAWSSLRYRSLSINRSTAAECPVLRQS